jgi:hypothetical protein
VKAKLLKGFAELTGIRATPSHAEVHRWRYAQTIQPLGQPYLLDHRGLGLCGDWCLGHRVEDAFVSGLELALARMTPQGGSGPAKPVPRGAEGPYRGRFAPSPTGPLHAGSLVAALASWLDARAHGGQWLVRIEDVDTPRCVPGADAEILQQLARAAAWSATNRRCGNPRATAAYASALQTLRPAGAAYPCTCTRKDIEGAWLPKG